MDAWSERNAWGEGVVVSEAQQGDCFPVTSLLLAACDRGGQRCRKAFCLQMT